MTASSGLEDQRPAGSTDDYYYATDTLNIWLKLVSGWVNIGVGPDKITAGTFTDANYLASPLGANNGPFTSSPFTFAMGFYVESLPGTNNHIITTHSDGAFGSGWNLGASATASNKMAMNLKGLTPSPVEMSGFTMTVGAHVLAVKHTGTTFSYCWDGGTVSTVTTSGTYTAAGSGTAYLIGRWQATSLPSDFASVAWVRGWRSALADADLQTLGTSPTTFVPPHLTTAPDYDWEARWFKFLAGSLRALGASASATTIFTVNGTVPMVAR